MKHPPGPRGTEVFGFFTNILGFLEATAQKHGSISYFRLLHQNMYLLNDAELIRQVLIVQQNSFGRDLGALILRELVGDGLITRDEPEHKERRRVLQPAFHREQIASYVSTMANETEMGLAAWSGRSSEPLDIGSEMRRITLSIIGSTLFGPEFRESATAISGVLRRVLGRAGSIVPFLSLFKPLTRYYRKVWPSGPSLFFARERGELDRILQPLIDQRRRQSSTGQLSKDVLSLLLMLQESETEGFADDAIRNEIVTFVLAGHETTATALTWAWYLLAKHPEVQEKLADEAIDVLEDRLPTIDDLPRLLFASSVFTETLRLYPPVAVYGRRAIQPVELGGYTIPRNASVLLSPFVTAHNPAYFPDPYAFKPDRWETTPQPPRFAYFPFGGGAKMCIGDTFAKTEGTLILAAVARRFKLHSTGSPEPVFSQRATLQPLHPILLRAEERSRS